MTDNNDDDDIPVLTEAIERTPPPAPGLTPAELAHLEHDICASSLKFAETVLRDACQEAEHIMKERVMSALRQEMPALVHRALQDHFDR